MDLGRALERIVHIGRHLRNDKDAQSPLRFCETPLAPSRCQAPGEGGWLPNLGGQPVVIGGMVMDIQGMTAKEQRLQRGTTTPGKVFFTHGGVARNVAECMACLGAPPFLISVVGRDPPGEAMFAHWQELGLPLEGILRKAGIATPIVSAVLDPGGEIAASIDDITAIEEYLTPEWILRFEDVIAQAPIVVLDANLLPDAIWTACQIASKHGVPTWFEPVSVSKSTRATRSLSLLTFVSPSQEEVASMASTASAAPSSLVRELSEQSEFPQAFGVRLGPTSKPSVALSEPGFSVSLRTYEGSKVFSGSGPSGLGPGESLASGSKRGTLFSRTSDTPASLGEKSAQPEVTGLRGGDCQSSGSASSRSELRSLQDEFRPQAESSRTGKRGPVTHSDTLSGSPHDVAFSAEASVPGGLNNQHQTGRSQGDSVTEMVQQYEPDVRKILEAGVRYVVLTLGARGVCVSRFATEEDNRACESDQSRSGADVLRSSLQPVQPAPSAALTQAARYGRTVPSSVLSAQCRLPSKANPFGSTQTRAMAGRSNSQSFCQQTTESYAVVGMNRSRRRIVHHHVPAIPARVVGLTGAGDSVVAGAVAGLVTGQAANPVEAAAFGVAAAKRTVQSERNVPEGLSLELIREDATVARRLTARIG